jgi:hypothetical protein
VAVPPARHALAGHGRDADPGAGPLHCRRYRERGRSGRVERCRDPPSHMDRRESPWEG